MAFREHRTLKRIPSISSFSWKITKWSELSGQGATYHSHQFFLLPDITIQLRAKVKRNGVRLWIDRHHPMFSNSTVHCKACLVDKNTHEQFKESKIVTFQKYEFGKLFTKWNADTLKACYSQEDILTIRCTLSVGINSYGFDCTSNPEAVMFTETSSANFVAKRSIDLETFFKDHSDTDCVLKVGEVNFPVHRAVLSYRSKVFSDILHNDTSEDPPEEVNIQDVEAFILSDILYFIYTGMVRGLNTDTAVPMYAAADKYQLLEMKKSCMEFLLHNLKIDNICDAAVLAHNYGEEDLEKKVVQFIIDRFEEIEEDDCWKHLVATNDLLANKLLSRAFPGKQLD